MFFGFACQMVCNFWGGELRATLGTHEPANGFLAGSWGEGRIGACVLCYVSVPLTISQTYHGATLS